MRSMRGRRKIDNSWLQRSDGFDFGGYGKICHALISIELEDFNLATTTLC